MKCAVHDVAYIGGECAHTSTIGSCDTMRCMISKVWCGGAHDGGCGTIGHWDGVGVAEIKKAKITEVRHFFRKKTQILRKTKR